MASRMARARTASFIVSAGERSTLTPSRSVSWFSRRAIPTNERRLDRSRSAIRSTSDWADASPRATEPNSRRCTMPAALSSGSCWRNVAMTEPWSIPTLCHTLHSKFNSIRHIQHLYCSPSCLRRMGQRSCSRLYCDGDADAFSPSPCRYRPAKSRKKGQFGPGVCPNWCWRKARSPSTSPVCIGGNAVVPRSFLPSSR